MKTFSPCINLGKVGRVGYATIFDIALSQSGGPLINSAFRGLKLKDVRTLYFSLVRWEDFDGSYKGISQAHKRDEGVGETHFWRLFKSQTL